MKEALIGFLLLSFAAVSAAPRTGVELQLKGGWLDNYSQRGLDLPTYDVDRLNSAGAQFYLSKLPVVDLIVGADYSWCDRGYVIDNQDLPFYARDLAVTISAVYPLKVSALEFYLGGGIGSHSISYEYRRPAALQLEDFGVEIPGTSTDFGIHGVVGGKTSLASAPLGLFWEMRLYHIDAAPHKISYTSWTAGLTISLE